MRSPRPSRRWSSCCPIPPGASAWPPGRWRPRDGPGIRPPRRWPSGPSASRPATRTTSARPNGTCGEALRIASRHHLGPPAGGALAALASVQFLKGQAAVALDTADRAAGMLTGNDLAVLRSHQATMLLWMGRPAEALDRFAAALRVFRRNADLPHQAIVYGNRGLLHLHSGALAAAVRDLRRSEQLYRELGNRRWVAHVDEHLGMAFARRGDLVGRPGLRSTGPTPRCSTWAPPTRCPQWTGSRRCCPHACWPRPGPPRRTRSTSSSGTRTTSTSAGPGSCSPRSRCSRATGTPRWPPRGKPGVRCAARASRVTWSSATTSSSGRPGRGRP